MNPVQAFIRTTAAGALLALYAGAHAAALPLKTADGAPTVLAEEQETVQVAADLLRRDLGAVVGAPARPVRRLEDCARVCFVLGRHDSVLMADVARRAGVDLSWLRGQWERYERAVLPLPGAPDKHMVLIAGADARGTAYGVIDVTRELGISAWEWWADVAPPARPDAALATERLRARAPSVRYRGIFLNDEDWGLQPWAARHDPSGDIGPATYARIFELMLRLKANLVWPAMHDSTTPFYQIDGNAEVAKKYGIVVGTSHAEPMMRNNVREWVRGQRGDFNFFTNRKALVDYWGERVAQVKGYENVYSVGIRGVHDSAMEGATSLRQARDAVGDAIGVQRQLLASAHGQDPAHVPQALTLYKEVLDIYRAGLQVPDDITLLWPDDNYGYLHQLSTPAEARRGGGTGLYYHLSYWGRPHDYLWLGTTNPELVRDQLQRAVATGARKMWVANVGDIKPLEYLTQYFLDCAFDADLLNAPAQDHLRRWVAQQFGAAAAGDIAAVLRDYYELAWERRPEFMGFSQVESITPVRQSDYLGSGGEEAERRLQRYQALAERARALGASLPASLREAYFQLVLYPVQSSAHLNLRILKLDLAAQYAREGRQAASLYARQAAAAQQAISRDTAEYNAMAQGKWAGMMDAAPRKLPVFEAPLFPAYGRSSRDDCTLAYPGALSSQGDSLNFTAGVAGLRTLTVVRRGASAQTWSVAAAPAGIGTEVSGGTLDAGNGFEQRVAVRYDGKGAVDGLVLRCGEAMLKAAITLAPAPVAGLPGEQERIVALPAATGAATKGWGAAPGLGSYGNSMRADLDLPSRPLAQASAAPVLSYAFSSTSSGEAQLVFVALPVHPLTSENQVRVAYRLDDGPMQLLDFATRGRSDEWKRNVLSNTAVRSVRLDELPPGAHRLQVFALDPGFVLDRIEVRFDGAPNYYGKPL
ncbi:hypothetical protein GM676_26085 [Duganella radicis]|uniref:Gylcosyl hydrolase 115 C-terminal domain-containing protein n=2 Tax=Duganella radicis TaxID=551988 RepID=A0A6L6PPI9_9BURK|nr:hypothetical protein [Duganella radicis]